MREECDLGVEDDGRGCRVGDEVMQLMLVGAEGRTGRVTVRWLLFTPAASHVAAEAIDEKARRGLAVNGE